MSTQNISLRDQNIINQLKAGDSLSSIAYRCGVSPRTVGRVRDKYQSLLVGQPQPTVTDTKPTGPVVKSYGIPARDKAEEAVEPVKDTIDEAPTPAEDEYDFMVSKNTVTIVRCSDGESFGINSNNADFAEVRRLVIDDGNFLAAIELIDKKQLISRHTVGLLSIENGVLSYAGRQIDNRLANRIISDIKTGNESYKNLSAFMDRAMNNISSKAVEELWDFIAHCDIEITPDGYIVGWKKVTKAYGNQDAEYVDSYTKKIPNDVGSIVYMPRSLVNDDRTKTCEQGLHVGAWEYVPSFTGDTILRVLVDPADVVSVPSDYNGAKMRVGKYYISGIVDNNRKLITEDVIPTGKIVKAGPAGFYVVEHR